jgi:hypothetical protein
MQDCDSGRHTSDTNHWLKKKTRPRPKAETILWGSQVELPSTVRRAIPVAGVASSTLCPVPQPLDLLRHQRVQRDDLCQGSADSEFPGLAVLVEGQLHGFDGSPILETVVSISIRALPVQPRATCGGADVSAGSSIITIVRPRDAPAKIYCTIQDRRPTP